MALGYLEIYHSGSGIAKALRRGEIPKVEGGVRFNNLHMGLMFP